MKRRIDARQAVSAAVEYFRKLFPQPAGADARLEEIEPSGDGKYWLVTLGFYEPPPQDARIPDFLQVPIRKLKIFKVSSSTGEVISMKMREE